MKSILSFFKVLLILVGLASSQAEAQIDFGVSVGGRSNQAETDIRGATINARTGMNFGVLTIFDINKGFAARSGFFYTQRYSEIQNTAAGVVSVDYTYFDIPLTAMYRFNEAAGVFAGPVIAFSQSKEVSCTNRANCAALDVNSVIVPWQLGLNFKFMPQVGAELVFEYTPGDLSTNVSNMRGIGGNLIYYFE